MSTKSGRYVLIETAIATVFSIAFNVGISWLALGRQDPVTLWGQPGLAIGFLPATFMTVLMVVLVSTLLTRARRRAGKAPLVAPSQTRLPGHALVRALVVGVIATMILAPAAVATLHFAYPGPYSLMWALACNTVYAVLLVAIVAPPMLRAALSEQLR